MAGPESACCRCHARRPPDAAPRRRITRRGWVTIAILFAVLLATLASLFTRLTPHVRDLAVKALNERFDSETEIATLQVSIFPQPAVSGTGLVVRYKGRRDVAPLITVKAFSASASIPGLMFKRLHLKTIDLEGLDIRVPPGGLRRRRALAAEGRAEREGAGRARDRRRTAPPAARRPKSPILIDTITVARLAAPDRHRRPEQAAARVRDPRSGDDRLRLRSRRRVRGATLQLEAGRRNPRQGHVRSVEHRDPRMTALGADYEFDDANLDTIKGIGGILSSKGRFHGVLERIRVEGTTDTPDFRVDIAGQPVHLQTRFAAVVDGTNGNTWLEPVEATLLGRRTSSRAAKWCAAEDVKGRKVYLQVTIDDARMEDILRLAIKSKQMPLTGQMKMQTTFLLPAGEADVPQRLQLDGAFSIAKARFTSFNVQQRIDTLSRRGRGDTSDSGPSVVSNLSGRFVMKDGRIRLRNLTFAVPGSAVQLAGSFDLKSEQLDFGGHLLLDASLSETVTGFKSVLVKLAQPFFRRPGGGTKLPIRVSGTPEKPAFGLDVKRALTRGN